MPEEPEVTTARATDALKQLTGSIEPVRKPPLYFLGLLLVTLAMIALPLVYVALIVTVGFLVFIHAVVNISILTAGGNIRVRLLGYFGPIVVGLVVIVFLVKPLFARPPRRPAPFSLDPEKEPLVFSFVHDLCRLLRAPRPSRIDLDCEVNASASFRRGFASMFGDDLVLTIGLPLVEGMTLRQLLGILAHELGHFAQGGGMRLSYVIRSISHWFARVVYERDSFDESLRQASSGGNLGFVQIVVWGAQACVWFSRRILWLLMMVGHLISCFLLRQMEYDADRYEVRLAGSEEFSHTMQRLIRLTVGQQIAQRDLRHFWRERKLPQQYPQVVRANAEMLADEQMEQVWSRGVSRKTGWLDTHPSDGDRIKRALAAREPGLLQTDLPAASLFSDFSTVSQAVTVALYRNVLGEKAVGARLVSTAQLLSDRMSTVRSTASYTRFFQGNADPDAPIFLGVGEVETPADLDGLKKAVEDSRREISGPLSTAPSEREEALRRRLLHSLQLLKSPVIRQEMTALGEGSVPLEIDERVALLHRLEKNFKTVRSMRDGLERLMAVFRKEGRVEDEKKHRKKIFELAGTCRAELEQIRDELEAVTYPYAPEGISYSCAEIAVPRLPEEGDLQAIVNDCAYCLNSLYHVYFRLVADLTAAAEMAEKAAGFAPLALPQAEETEEAADGR